MIHILNNFVEQMTVLYYCTVQQFGVEQMTVLYSTKMGVHNFCGWARSRRCCWLDRVCIHFVGLLLCGVTHSRILYPSVRTCCTSRSISAQLYARIVSLPFTCLCTIDYSPRPNSTTVLSFRKISDHGVS